MTAKELDERLQPIKDYLQQCKEASKILEIFASGSFVAVDFGSQLLHAYIDAISRELGDTGEDTWLDWFIWENEFGKKKYDAVVDGKTYVVKNTAVLLMVIKAWSKSQKKTHQIYTGRVVLHKSEKVRHKGGI